MTALLPAVPTLLRQGVDVWSVITWHKSTRYQNYSSDQKITVYTTISEKDNITYACSALIEAQLLNHLLIITPPS